jgi:predicted DNA-binding WGR domain protein
VRAVDSAEQKEDWGELGPAMRALPNDRWRNMVRFYVADTKHGALTRAARKAGWGRPNTKAQTLSKQAWALSRDERFIAAVSEECQRLLRIGQPEAVAALYNVIRDPKHRDHMRAVALVLDRTDPLISKHIVDVTHHKVDPDREALEQLKALRKVGATREKLLELYGPNGLDRIEALEAIELAQRSAAAKVIEHAA